MQDNALGARCCTGRVRCDVCRRWCRSAGGRARGSKWRRACRQGSGLSSSRRTASGRTADVRPSARSPGAAGGRTVSGGERDRSAYSRVSAHRVVHARRCCRRQRRGCDLGRCDRRSDRCGVPARAGQPVKRSAGAAVAARRRAHRYRGSSQWFGQPDQHLSTPRTTPCSASPPSSTRLTPGCRSSMTKPRPGRAAPGSAGANPIKLATT